MLRISDLSDIAYAMNNVMMDIEKRDIEDKYRDGMEITIHVSAEEMLAMDDDLYRMGHGGDNYGFIPGDEISLTINRIRFRIVRRGDEV